MEPSKEPVSAAKDGITSTQQPAQSAPPRAMPKLPPRSSKPSATSAPPDPALASQQQPAPSTSASSPVTATSAGNAASSDAGTSKTNGTDTVVTVAGPTAAVSQSKPKPSGMPSLPPRNQLVNPANVTSIPPGGVIDGVLDPAESAKTQETRRNVHEIRVALIRAAFRLGYDPDNGLVKQVLYRYAYCTRFCHSLCHGRLELPPCPAQRRAFGCCW